MDEIRQIKLMDIRRQHASHAEEIEAAALEVLRSGSYIGGERVAAFENEFAAFTGAKYAVGVANGTDALVIALRSIGVGAGDEVITVSCTFFATAEAVMAVGAKPIFVDVLPDTYCMDPSAIEGAINERTKAILVVHFYGHCADMDAINEIAKRHSLLVVEDSAQAAGSFYKGRHAGTLGDIGCFSFYPTKSLGADGDAGMIITNNEAYEAAATGYRAHGSGEGAFEVLSRQYAERGEKVPDDLPKGKNKYYNYLVGYNSRLDALQAAILRVKLKYLPQFIERRRENAAYYNSALKGTSFVTPYESEDCVHSYYLYVLRHPRAKVIIEKLRALGVGCDTYYPVPLHLQGAMISHGYSHGDFPVTEEISEHSFAIPVYPELEDDEREYIAEALLRIEAELD